MSIKTLKTWIRLVSLAIVVSRPATLLAQVPNLHQGPVFLIIGETSGQFNSCHEDNGSPLDCHQNVFNLFSQLRYQGVSDWKQWMQSMPEPCQLTYTSGSPSTLNYFSVNHSPAVYYDDIV